MNRLIAIAVILGACGGKKDEGAPAAKSQPAPTAPTPTPTAEPTPAPTPPAAPNTQYGSCHFKVTGVVTAEETTPGGASAQMVTSWLDAKSKEVMKISKDSWMVNCTGKDVQLTISSNTQTGPATMGPKDYTLDGKNNKDAGVLFGGKISALAAKGTVKITALDDTHIAGTFSLEGDSLADPKGAFKAEGEFDFKKP